VAAAIAYYEQARRTMAAPVPGATGVGGAEGAVAGGAAPARRQRWAAVARREALRGGGSWS
jgi:hypothetical protein